jgi:hypothetical protein
LRTRDIIEFENIHAKANEIAMARRGGGWIGSQEYDDISHPVIRDAAKLQVTARWQETVDHIVGLSDGRTWAFTRGDHLQIVTLEHGLVNCFSSENRIPSRSVSQRFVTLWRRIFHTKS